MREILLLFLVALVAAGIVFGVIVVVTGRDRGLAPAAPDDGHRALPGDRPLLEEDLSETRFDTALRGYRMAQVDRALNRVGYDLGYKHELIAALEAEVDALREGRMEDADQIRDRRYAAREPATTQPAEGRADGEPSETGAGPEPGSEPETGADEHAADRADDQADEQAAGATEDSADAPDDAFAPPR